MYMNDKNMYHNKSVSFLTVKYIIHDDIERFLELVIEQYCSCNVYKYFDL